MFAAVPGFVAPGPMVTNLSVQLSHSFLIKSLNGMCVLRVRLGASVSVCVFECVLRIRLCASVCGCVCVCVSLCVCGL